VVPSMTMRGWRRRGAWIAGVWLVCQMTALAVSPLALTCRMSASVATNAEDDDECCKGLAPGQMCPLHKHRAHGQHHSSSGHAATAPATHDASRDPACKLRSTCDPLTLAIESLLPGSGLLPHAASVADDLIVRAMTMPSATDAPTRTISPDLPPPRG